MFRDNQLALAAKAGGCNPGGNGEIREEFRASLRGRATEWMMNLGGEISTNYRIGEDETVLQTFADQCEATFRNLMERKRSEEIYFCGFFVSRDFGQAIQACVTTMEDVQRERQRREREEPDVEWCEFSLWWNDAMLSSMERPESPEEFYFLNNLADQLGVPYEDEDGQETLIRCDIIPRLLLHFDSRRVFGNRRLHPTRILGAADHVEDYMNDLAPFLNPPATVALYHASLEHCLDESPNVLGQPNRYPL